MDTAKELQVLREELIREIDEKIGQMLKKLQNENNTNHQKNHVQTRVYESVYPLNVGTGIYKGKRPTAVIFPGEVRKECPTWKKVMEEILKDCCKNLERHQMLMDLRGKILGRNRVPVSYTHLFPRTGVADLTAGDVDLTNTLLPSAQVI